MQKLNYYAVTVKYVYGSPFDVSTTDYGHWICHAKDIHYSLDFLETKFEYDSGDRLHMHCLMATPLKRLYLKKLQKYGFNIDLQPLPEEDIPRWLNYITKDERKQYMFVDDNDNDD